ncbi:MULTISPECIES: Rap1a/Tai family immunity protein [Brenneria]|uniref:Rap1a immunity protein domain-containing protein n=1 Tax=Brenneria nigrifluens DSM 30175 = ATCC 13028 TaxID=1121120 RepID=A0A2U1UUZ2_9GAMM|nr:MULTISPECIES: Rap1a/Tai family immunity protein [Brenneria]EHD22072.1 hypothetical protein BrE312_2695 [Brenneria sp. EniD312]MCL2899785.1 hypothetical protein [Brenneria tiliae]MCL2904726.1 hypothetical protein [Brenneria tiliae]PWC25401.1 hypothetical protein DDT54_05765 [Brenneria nigrifluens DSM 30175 = ATCC 13028]QCR05152.1 hypothetical protein EH206_13725 [Brenneria nigrifluens DSM 30175 = ATCC 13028]
MGATILVGAWRRDAGQGAGFWDGMGGIMGRLFLFVFLFVCGASNSLAEISEETLRDQWNAVKLNDKSHTGLTKTTAFIGYVLGVADSENFKGPVCIPDEVTPNVIVKTVGRYLDKTPNMKGPAQGVVYFALSEAYPCPYPEFQMCVGQKQADVRERALKECAPLKKLKIR